MRRKRGNRATWFPTLGFDAAFTGDPVFITTDIRNLNVTATPSRNVVAIPIIPDETQNIESAEQNVTLRDFVEGQTCIVERCVGKIVWGVQQRESEGYSPNVVICCSALAILPVADDTNLPDLPSDEYDPLRPENSQAPWLWRRTWVLSNNVKSTFTHPASNEFFASAYDGPHLDTKGSKRAIRREQRIFLIHSAINGDPLPQEGSPEATATVVWSDLRVIGRMVRSRNKSTFK